MNLNDVFHRYVRWQLRPIGAPMLIRLHRLEIQECFASSRCRG